MLQKLQGSKKIISHITKTSMARIDQFWITPQLAHKIIEYKCYEQSIINTDHNAINLTLDWFEYNPTYITTNKILQL